MTRFLSKDQRDSLKTQHKRERDKRICDRIKAVLLCDEGRSFAEVAHILLLDDQTVKQHVTEYLEQNKLTCNHKGSPGKLDSSQIASLQAHLESHTYLYVKDIVAYVRAQWGVIYTVAGMTHWLHSQKFSYKKPALVPGKANRAAQEAWIQEYDLLKTSLKPGETICFLDGVHPTHNTKPSYGWMRKGLIKPICSNTGRRRLNIAGALDILSKRVVIEESETLDTEFTLIFLKKLEQAYPEATKVYLFCDNARYYKNRAVQAFLASSKLQMRFLPPYSPNLNPIERLWKWMNEKVLYNRYYERFRDFRDAVLGFLQGLETATEDEKEVLQTKVRDRFRVVGS